MGVKFGMEEWTFGPLLHAKFHAHRCNDKGSWLFVVIVAGWGLGEAVLMIQQNRSG